MISLYFGNVLFFSLVYDVEEVQYVSFWSSPQRKGRVLSTKFPRVFSPSVDSRTENSNAKCTSASLAPVSSHVPPDPPHSRQPPQWHGPPADISAATNLQSGHTSQSLLVCHRANSSKGLPPRWQVSTWDPQTLGCGFNFGGSGLPNSFENPGAGMHGKP